MFIIIILQDIYVINNIIENIFIENVCNLYCYNIIEIYVIFIIYLGFF